MIEWLILYAGWAGLNHIAKKQEAFDRALELSNGRGIINLGATGTSFAPLTGRIAQDPKVKVNVDLFPDSIPKLVQFDLEITPYPFADKQFNVAFCSHTLEHLQNWGIALMEMTRIADYVVLVLPHPYSIGKFCPEHKQQFGFADFDQIRAKYPNVEIYA